MKSMIKVTDRNMIQSFRYCVRKKENGLIVFDKYKIKKNQMSCNSIAISYSISYFNGSVLLKKYINYFVLSGILYELVRF